MPHDAIPRRRDVPLAPHGRFLARPGQEGCERAGRAIRRGQARRRADAGAFDGEVRE